MDILVTMGVDEATVSWTFPSHETRASWPRANSPRESTTS
jgi:hypothetical protein